MKIKLWHVLHGPFHRDEIPHTEGVPDDLEWMMIIKAEVGKKKDKKVIDMDFWFRDLDEAYAIVRHFQTSIEPIKMKL